MAHTGAAARALLSDEAGGTGAAADGDGGAGAMGGGCAGGCGKTGAGAAGGGMRVEAEGALVCAGVGYWWR